MPLKSEPCWIMVDVEADGPIPGDYSMIALGAVVVEPALNRTFMGKLRPISGKHIPEALAISGFSRDETMGFELASKVMYDFEEWLKGIADKPRFVADNNGFDWQFVNWYFHHFRDGNPFGFSSMNLGSFYKGVIKNMRKNFKHLRKTAHDHDPVHDALGNAEAMLTIASTHNIEI